MPKAQRDSHKAPPYRCPSPVQVVGDPTRLRQVLYNFYSNAIKFTEAGEVKLEVSCDAESQRVKFVIIDTGIGMT